ncbi:MAG TPA: ABC transporter permease [Chloroflexi bacterium]|jgi:ABC-2 type transport system permease protein|nr:ABC transporter permease [Chloroflexota bacterium]HPO57685.1 ABC transporter permease [Anaerolineaceae bacterium]
MIQDIGTLIWKELREVFLNRGNMRGGLWSTLIYLGLLGVFMPIQTGRGWLSEPFLPLIWSWLPVLLALSVVTDAFAGERERHTLETLLASRLTDQTILFGKIAAAVVYAWGIGVAGFLLAAVTINVAFPEGGLIFYSLETFFIVLSLSFLATLLISVIGVMVSLRSETTRQAYQRVSIVLMALIFLPVLASQLLPADVVGRVMIRLSGLNLRTLLLGAIGVLLVVDAVLLGVAVKTFRRNELVMLIS